LASLTETERSVADIIAEGATNREAAARLFLSPHTTDYHLRQIFRKLAIGSRVELARLVPRQAEADRRTGLGNQVRAYRQARWPVPWRPDDARRVA
jgi:DNA-binding CsgD family transcriptional regulator